MTTKKKLEKLTTEGPVPLVLFSGGLDSTYLLATMLEQTDVEILYIFGPQGVKKATQEMKAQKRILAWLKKNRPYSVREVRLMIQPEGVPANHNYRYVQPLSWILGAMVHAQGDLHTQVNIAYVQGDNIARHVTELQWAWDYLKAVVMTKPIPLVFPLLDINKTDIMDEMPEDLLKLVWYCEMPVRHHQCGKCTPCITHQTERYRRSLQEAASGPNEKKE